MTDEMTSVEIQAELDAIVKLLSDKGLEDPNCNLEFRSGGMIYVFTHFQCTSKSEGKFHFADTASGALKLARQWVADLDDAETVEKRIAVEAFGQSIDGLRSAGFDADFVDPLSDQLQAMSKNLLTYNGAAS